MLRFVLRNHPGEAGWTKADLARNSDVSVNGGADENLEGLVVLGLLRTERGRYWPGDPAATLYIRLLDLLDELEHVPDHRLGQVERG